VRLRNRQDFRGLGWLRGQWELAVDGATVASGDLPQLQAGPGEAQTIPLDVSAAAATPGERFLTFRFFQRDPTPWADAGHEVAWGEVVLPAVAPRITPAAHQGSAVTVEESPDRIVLAAGEVRAEFDRQTGVLTSFGAEKGNVLRRGPKLNVWRAAIDNDGLKLRNDPRKPLGRWQALGLPALGHELRRITVVERGPDSATVEVVHAASGRAQWSDFSHRQRYTLRSSGDLLVENLVQLGDEISDLPRVGVGLLLVPGLERLDWFGRGPWDNYSDRKASAMVGRWHNTVTDQYVPYVMPQEHGHKCDVRRLTLSDEQGRSLTVLGQPTFEFSALHLSDDDLYQARHTTDLTPRAEVYLNIDAAQRGLGTLSCGPDTLERYRLLEREYRFAYRLTATAQRVE
jgi:beta-galactosidase